MGLGKTVEIVALILADKQARLLAASTAAALVGGGAGGVPKKQRRDGGGGGGGRGGGGGGGGAAEGGGGRMEGSAGAVKVEADCSGRARATLIVVPVTLVQQWMDEIYKAVGPALTVVQYDSIHGRCKPTPDAPRSVPPLSPLRLR